jgi:hypothetical protein
LQSHLLGQISHAHRTTLAPDYRQMIRFALPRIAAWKNAWHSRQRYARIHYATGIVSSCINIDVYKRDIWHFDVWSARPIAVAVFVYASLWPTATFVSLQSKLVETMLCLFTHALHSFRFAQVLVLQS